MTEQGKQTDTNSLPDDEIRRIIKENEAAAEEVKRLLKHTDREIAPLRAQIGVLEAERWAFIDRVRLYRKQARHFRQLLESREEARRREAVTRTALGMIKIDAERLALTTSSAPLAQGLARVLQTVSVQTDLQKALPDVVEADVLAPSRSNGKINVKTANGDRAHVRFDVNGGYTVGYHTTEQTDPEVLEAMQNVWTIAEQDPYVREYSLRVNRKYIGFGVSSNAHTHDAYVVPLVMLQNPNKGHGHDPIQFRPIPQAKAIPNLTRPIEFTVGNILLNGVVSVPTPQNPPRRKV